MNDFILVEFLAHENDRMILMNKLHKLDTDFQLINVDEEWKAETDYNNPAQYIRVSGKINSTYASVIKLQDSFLADRMRISYIPKELKDRYRR